MAKRYLGYGYTNAQGIAKLEYDPDGEPLTHSYTGVGAGKIDIVAESGSLQSEEYSIMDALFYDEATQSSHRNDYTNSGLTVTYDGTGTTLTPTSSSSSSSTYTLSQECTDSICVEFDFKINTRNGNNIRFFIGGANLYYTTAEMADGNVHHFKAIVDGSSVTATVDDVDAADGTRTSNTNIRFVLASECAITFKDLKVYPV